MKLLTAFLCAAATLAAQVSAPEIRTISERAYIFAYPMILMEYTRRAAVERGTMGAGGGTNEFANLQRFPDDTFHQVIRPNADTLYSAAWIDLSKEPVLLHVPDVHDRYYLMQFMDAWTETFSVPGKRTTGTGEGWFALVGPGWKGTLPERAKRIDAPTNMVWLIGRTQTNGAGDYENVHAIQRGYQLMTLSQYPDGPPRRPAARPAPRGEAGGTPPMKVQALTPEEFFRTFAELLPANPPHPGDEPMMRELAKIGIEPGKPFRPESLGAEGTKALDQGAEAAVKRLASLDDRVGKTGPTGWSGGAGKSRPLWDRLHGARGGGAHRIGREPTGRRGVYALPPGFRRARLRWRASLPHSLRGRSVAAGARILECDNVRSGRIFRAQSDQPFCDRRSRSVEEECGRVSGSIHPA